MGTPVEWEGFRVPTTVEASWTHPEGEYVTYRALGKPIRAER
jgi:hypothetical protein